MGPTAAAAPPEVPGPVSPAGYDMRTAQAANPKDAIGMTKASLRAVPPVALLHLGQAMMDGVRKYGLMNWRQHPVLVSIYYEAALRHLFAWWDGEDYAVDSGVHHLAHVMACCAIILDATASDTATDDRPEIQGRAPHFVGNPAGLRHPTHS